MRTTKKQKNTHVRIVQPSTVDGVLVVTSSARVAANLLRVSRSELFELRRRGFPGFHPSSRVYLLTLRDAVKKWKPTGPTDGREATFQRKWMGVFYRWMDREGMPGVPKMWQGEGYS